jgi:hypothetical protein
MKSRRTADDFRRDMEAKAHTTPGDAERKATIDANAREALKRIKGNATLEDWRSIGEKLQVITEEEMDRLGLDAWDPDNKKLTRGITARMDAWEREVNPNEAPMSKSERWALRTFVTDPKYSNWHVTLPGPQRRRMNAPGAIINAYNRAFPDPNKPKKERKVADALSPALTAKNKEIEQLKAREAELEEELTAARVQGATGSEAAPRDLDAARTAYVRLVIQTFGGDKKAIKAEGKRLAKASADLLYETIKAGSLASPKSRKRKTKGRVLGHIPGIGDITMED